MASYLLCLKHKAARAVQSRPFLKYFQKTAGTPCFHSVPAFFVFTGSVYLLHRSACSILTPHRFVRLLFGKTSQNWCSPGVVPQMPFENRLKFHRICVLIFAFYCSIGFIVGILSGISLQCFVMLHNRIFTCIPGIHNPS